MCEARLFALTSLACRHEQVDWAFAREEAGRIEAHWRSFSRANPAAFDGRVFLMHRWCREGDHFSGACLETTFSAFLAWRDFGFPDRAIRNVFAMAALRAADGAYLLGEMAAGTANPGRIYFPAGTPDRGDRLPDGSIDLAGSVLRELEEETGLRADEVRVGAGWVGVELGPRTAFMRAVDLEMSAEEARALIEARIKAQPAPELARIHLVRGPADLDEARMPAFQVAYLRWAFAQG